MNSRTTTRTRKKFFVIFSTVPNVAVARKISRALLDEHAAACVNIVPQIESHYRWQGKIESSRETLLIIKTTQRKVAAAMRVIRAAHPYEVPEIIALAVARGLPTYLKWIFNATDSHG